MISLLFAMAALGQTPEQSPKNDDTLNRGREIITQPAHDIGAAKTEIPAVLQRAHDNPYDLTGLKSCTRIKLATAELNHVLGPDFAVGNNKKENKAVNRPAILTPFGADRLPKLTP